MVLLGLVTRFDVPWVFHKVSLQFFPRVLQLATSPDFKPVVNHCERCAEVPWVNESGTTGLDILGVCDANRNFKDMNRLILFRKPLIGLNLFLASVRNCHDTTWRYPTHSFDVAVSDRAIVGSRKLIELSCVVASPVGEAFAP